MSTALAFMGRDFRVARSYKIAFAMTIASTIMSLVTFRFISKLVSADTALKIGDYFTFALVGLVVAQLLEGVLSAPATGVRQEQVQGTLEVLATAPLKTASLAAGWVAFPMAQSLATGAAMLAVGSALGLRFDHPNWAAAAVLLILTALAFAGLGILASGFVLVAQQSAGITAWIAAGLSLLSGVLFPLDLFPGWLRDLAWFSPMTHALNALRGALLHGESFRTLGADFAGLLLAAGVLLPLGIAAVSMGLRRARARGTIVTY
jgi:ABC-2 type transport system permease protein